MNENMTEMYCNCCCHISSENCNDCLILHGIESLENSIADNHIAIIHKKRSTDEEINDRRNKIFNDLVNYPDTTQEELAVKYSVSLSTIQRDMDAIKNTDPDWVDKLLRKDFLHKVRITSARIDKQISKLQYRLDNEDLDPKTEAYLMQKINEFATNQLNVEVNPALQHLRKINEKLASLPKHITSS